MDNNYKYILVEPLDMTTQRWDSVVQSNSFTTRKLSDGRMILKYRGSYPILWYGYTTYTNDEILEIINNDDPSN